MWIDIALLVFLALGFYLGYSKGIIHSLFSFAALFIGMGVAVKYSYDVSVLLNEQFHINTRYLPLLAFIGLFILALLLVRLISFLIEKFAETLYLGFINRMLGAALWCFLLTLVFSILLWFLGNIQFITKEDIDTSRTYSYIQPLAPMIFGYLAQLIPFFEGIFEALQNLIKDLSQNKEPIQA